MKRVFYSPITPTSLFIFWLSDAIYSTGFYVMNDYGYLVMVDNYKLDTISQEEGY